MTERQTSAEGRLPPFSRGPIAALAAVLATLAFGPGAQTAQAATAASSSAEPSTLAAASAAAYEFSSELLAGGAGASLDLSRFAKGNPLLAGVFRADIYVNDRWLGRRDIRMAGNPVAPCIDAELLRQIGLAAQAISPQGQALLRPGATGAEAGAGAQCPTLEQLTQDSHASFDVAELRLQIVVPQASLARQPKGYVPPESWDYGVNAGVLNYNLSAFRSRADGQVQNSVFAGLTGGLNLGRWRLRHSGIYNRATGSAARYDSLGTYAMTDLPDWKASLTLGDTYTTGQLFQSFKLRGVSLAKDNRMLPDSQRGYAPVIRGVASSNARVEVRQNNQLLYSTTVPPGPFEIDDLYPTGYGGDLQVTVTEADGSQKVSQVPFASLPQLLREGTLDYALHAGQMLGLMRKHDVAQGTVQYGLSNVLTLNGGLLAANNYASALVGGAWNTPLGAFQLNATQASFKRSSTERHNGWSLDSSWAKVFPTTSTNLNFAAYRYSSSGYYTLAEAMQQLDQDATRTFGSANSYRIKNRAILSVNQTLGGGMSLYAAANSQTYWNYPGTQSSYQLGLHRLFGLVQVSLNATSTRQPFTGSARQNTYSVGLTLPLGTTTTSRHNAVASFTHDSLNGDTEQAGVFGSYGERGELSYGVSGLHSRHTNSLAANASYQAKYATIGGSASSGNGYNQVSFHASGAVLGADGHVVLAPLLGDTVGLVHIDGAQGLKIAASQASEIDRDGYTVLPFLSPYSANPVELDLSKAPLSARFDSVSTVVAPHAGSVLLINFKRQPGYTLMLSGKRADGSPLPFGASVFDAKGELIGSVGQAGRIEAISSSLAGVLNVSWGDGPEAGCTIRYDLPAPAAGGDDDALVRARVNCQPATERLPQPRLSADAGDALRSAYLLVVRDDQGRPLPKGAEVQLAGDDGRVGVVADNGRLVLRLSAADASDGRLVARWTTPEGTQRSCQLDRHADAGGAVHSPSREAACPVQVSRLPGDARQLSAAPAPVVAAR